MATADLAPGHRVVRRGSRWEALMPALAAAHGVILLQSPTALVIALGLWWNANTISHYFIHRPFFRSRAANSLFAAYLSVLLGFPQSLWRDRHLAHHAGIPSRVRFSAELFVQVVLALSLWTAIAAAAPGFFLWTYLPGYLTGLGLCALHGYYEHASGTISHYGTLYNLLFFNDGYHAEHHRDPDRHWTRLPEHLEPGTRVSAWPAPLRWMEAFSLEGLERLVLRSPALQWFVLRAHASAFCKLADALPPIERIAIVGGGMYPRTALILSRLLPAARIAVIDRSRANLDRARPLLSGKIEFVHAHFMPAGNIACDLLVVPLSFQGNRDAIYARPPAAAVIVHDWIWRKRGESRVVSIWLLKRINLLRR